MTGTLKLGALLTIRPAQGARPPNIRQSKKMALMVRQPKTGPEFYSIYRLRYEVYVEELKWQERYADHSRKRIVDPLDETAYLLGAWDDDQCVGTVRTNFARDGQLEPYFDYYGLRQLPSEALSEVSITTRLMVIPALRKSPLSARLACATYRHVLKQGIKADYCDCIPKAVPFFLRLGYRLHLPEFHHPDYGLGVVLRLDLRDEAHLAANRSPFRKHLASWQARLPVPGAIPRRVFGRDRLPPNHNYIKVDGAT
jgi:predicted GNAT family N-acyltransferase